MSENRPEYHASPPVIIDLAVPYTCTHCGAHLGVYVYAHGRVCIDQGKGPLCHINGWCFNPTCARRYWFNSKEMTMEQVVAMREKIEGMKSPD